MPNTLRLRSAVTPGAVPTTLAAGELAINRADKEVYFADATNTITSLLYLDCGEITMPPLSLSLWRAEALDSNWHWSN